jgi:subtilisin family serine protease
LGPRTLAFGLTIILLAAALPAVTNAADPRSGTAPYLVTGAPLDGRLAVDDYGAFWTARLTPEQAEALRADGAQVEALDLTLRRGSWTIAGDDSTVPAPLRAAATDPFFVVQFRGPVKAAWQGLLAENVLAVYDSLPHYAYVVKALPAQVAALRALPEVAFVGAYHPAYKVAPELPTQGPADVAILAFPGEPLAGIAAHVAANGGQVRSLTIAFNGDGIVKAVLPAENVVDVALLPEVLWIEPAHEGTTLDNAAASAITQTGTTTQYRVHDKGVTGKTQILSVCDTGVKTSGAAPGIVPQVARRMMHEMYADNAVPQGKPLLWILNNGGAIVDHRKVHAYYPPIAQDDLTIGGDFDDTNGHGTHTAGTIAGDAPPYGQRNGHDGVAFAAKLMVCDITDGSAFFIASDYSVYWDPAYSAGARVNSNSWGSPHTTAYTEVARQHDAYVASHRDFLITRSMGNTGANTIRPEAVAKSAMGIGAGVNGAGMEDLASFSSRGPTNDGRIKPDVIAPGACLNSAGTSTNNYVCFSGTSMSTPAVAGAAGLVRDYFVQGFYPDGTANAEDSLNPSTALVRATLMASAKRITGNLAGTGFPNGNQGWGRVNLDDALFFDGDARKLVVEDEDQALSTGETATFTLTVGAGQPLRVMVAWTDAAAAAGANPALVNDLDLTVSGPGGNYVGNAFVGSEVPPNQGSADRRNVEEAVYITAPAAGTYTVTVRGANVVNGDQTFALVATHA